MTDEILYMLGVIAVGFAVNYTLRALPFILFSGRDREVPKWIDRLGGVLSPVIIAGLIVYSYWTLAIGPEKAPAWKTVWPYLAGALTVALHLWRRNALVSIIAGTVLYMVVVNCCGCTSRGTLQLDAQHPAVAVTTTGVKFGDDYVNPEQVPEILEDYDVPKTRTIHILLEPEVTDLRPARYLMACLARAGYDCPVLVTRQHGESYSTGRKTVKSRPTKAAGSAPGKIRYKKANE